MATKFQPRRRPSRFSPRPAAVPRQPATRPTTLPPAAVINAVLQHHDIADDQGGGRTLLRMSEDRAFAPDLAAALGRDVQRAARVAILWNERESQIIRVTEALAA